jgi:hypothetical protein
MKKLTRERVVPIISASISWLILGTTGSGLPSLPKFVMLVASVTLATPPDSVEMDANDPRLRLLKTTSMMNMIKKYKEGMDKLSPVVRKKLADLMEKYPNFTVGQLKQIKVPVLVVVGDRDAINIDHCYRVERTSSRAGVSPAEVQRLSRRTVTPTTRCCWQALTGGVPERTRDPSLSKAMIHATGGSVTSRIGVYALLCAV